MSSEVRSMPHPLADLALKLMVAYTAFRLGNSIATEDRRAKAEGTKPSEYWIELAERVEAEVCKKVEAALAEAREKLRRESQEKVERRKEVVGG